MVPKYGEVFSEERVGSAPDDKARLVIFKRKLDLESRYRSVQLEISLDGNKINDLVERSYFIVDVTPGEHEISAVVPMMKRPVNSMVLFGEKSISSTFEQGEIYFFHYEVDAAPLVRDYSEMDPAAEYQGFNGVNFSIVTEEIALLKISDCWYFEGLVPE